MGVLTKIQGRQLTWGPELVAALVTRGAQGRLGWHFFVSGIYRDCSLEALDRNVNVTVQSPQCDARNFQVGCLQPTRGPFVVKLPEYSAVGPGWPKTKTGRLFKVFTVVYVPLSSDSIKLRSTLPG